MINIYLIIPLLLNTQGAEGWFGLESLASFFESCSSRYINPDFEMLRKDLDANLFGQDIAKDILIAGLKNHCLQDPKKPLVITFHGWTGVGKNFVTEMIVKRFYGRGHSSNFVHYFSGRIHFPLSDPKSVSDYKINLQSWLKGNVTKCDKSFFVFDESDKVPPGVIDGIKPYLDYNAAVDGVDFRKSIFIFVSNQGGELITKKYLELSDEGIPRSHMKYKDFEKLLRFDLHKTYGAFKDSSIIEDHLISLYVPFLPLEKVHVQMCIEAEFKRYGYTPSDKETGYILRSMEYYLDTLSVSGCKRVSDHVGLVIYGRKKASIGDEL